MTRTHTLPTVIAVALLAMFGVAQAQGSAQAREQVTMERDAFLKAFEWNETQEQWVLKSGVEPPAGVISRQEAKAQRDTFLSMNRWSEQEGARVPIAGTPRNVSSMSRADAKRETAAFLKTHRFDEQTGQWVKK
jgi:hypothetical protein